MRLAGVRRQLEEAREALVRSGEHAAAGRHDPAYREALRSRNLLFHATRGVAAARGETIPEMPVTGVPGGAGPGDAAAALVALDTVLAVADEGEMALPLERARHPYALYLGWLREEVGRELRAAAPPADPRRPT